MKRNTYADDRVDDSRQAAIESNWIPIEAELKRHDPFRALELYRAAHPRYKLAISRLIFDWMAKMLALPPTKQFPWADDQGVCRLIYFVWPKFPLRMFDPEDLPELWQHLARYDHEFRHGGWVGARAPVNDAESAVLWGEANANPPGSTKVATQPERAVQGLLEALKSKSPEKDGL